MISFIVIGKNEGWRLTKCIAAIQNVIVTDSIKESEIIYVDSKSTDDSIENVVKYPGIKIFKITGECNAAIGRNIGAKEAEGDILFFIDGDMELLPGAASVFLNEEEELIYPFCTGFFDNYFYDEEWKFIEKQKGNYSTIMTEPIYQPVTGGLFLITKQLWEDVGGMDTRFVRSQDIDLGLRLAGKNILQLKKPVLIVNHYTISYLNKDRAKSLKKINAHLYRGLLLRRNLFNKYYYKYALRSDYTAFSLVLSIILSILSPFFLLIYVFLILMRVTMLSVKRVNSAGYFNTLKDYMLRDFNLLISLLFFHPKLKQINYIQIK